MKVRLKSFSAFGIMVGLLILSASCQKKVNTTNSGEDGNLNPSGNNPTPTPTGTAIGGDPYNHSACPTGSPPGYSDAGQNIEYYKLNSPTLSAHGSAGLNRYASYHPGGVVWSSLLDMSTSISQNALITNSRFNVRVRALPGVGGNALDSKGIPCQYTANDYTKIQLGITLKKQGTSSGDYYLFDNVGVNQFSGVHPFTVPFNTNDPLVIEVKDIKWDYTCIDYTNQGFPDVPGACPYAKVWDTSCVAFEIQFSTDDTKDIPCPKVY